MFWEEVVSKYHNNVIFRTLWPGELSRDLNLEKHKTVLPNLFEWQGPSFQGCRIDSKEEKMLDVGKGKVSHVLQQKLMTGIWY